MNRSAKLRIGFNPDFAPLCHLDGTEPGGIVIERAAEALARADLTPEWRPLALPMMLDALRAGEVDALAGVAVTSQRSAELSYSKPLVVSGGAWFALAGTDWPEDLSGGEGARVITPSAGPLVRLIREQFPQLALVTCRTYDEALAAVVAGTAGAAALNWHVGRARVERDYPGQFTLPPAPFVEIPLAIAVMAAGGDATLLRLNDYIPDIWASWREPNNV